MSRSQALADPAFPLMTMDILSSVLSRAGNPGDLGKYLTEEIRELTGAQCVLLVQHLESSGIVSHRMVSMNPERRRELAQTPEMRLLIEAACQRTEPSLWEPEGTGAEIPLLRQLGFGLSLALPLRAGAFPVGAMLVLGLSDSNHIDAVLALLKTLSTIVAMSLRNAFLYEQQEQIIQERTCDLQRANQALRQSLDEKVVLLKEVHHRVKNNLQIVISLLNLQGGRIQNPEALTILNTTQARIHSMALLHETLYRSENLSRIHFDLYLSRITSHLLRSFSPLGSRVKIACQAQGVELGLDQAVPCSLIINELVCNSLKYAFPGERMGSITVDMVPQENQLIRLTVADDGVGFPSSFVLENAGSLGLHLVRTLALQLGGKLEVERCHGATFHITFRRKEK